MSKPVKFNFNHLKNNYLEQKDLLKNSFALFTGATLGQLAPFLAGPILSRLYSPSDFGLFALMSTTAGIASIISTGSFEYAIVTSDEEDADDLAVVSGIISLIFSFISATIIFTIISMSVPLVESSHAWLWLLVPLYIFLQGLTSVMNYRFNRHSGYREMAKGKVIRDSSMTFAQLIFGILRFNWGLLPGVIMGQFVAVGFFFKRVWHDLRISLKGLTFKRFGHLVKKYYRFPLFLMPSQLINELSVHIPIYCLNFFFGNYAVGLYSLPQKFLNIPVVLIGNSVGQVFYKDAQSQLNSPDQLRKRTLSLFMLLFFLSVIPFSVIIVFGDIIISWAFGAEWLQSGIYSQYLSLWLMFVLIGSPISRLFAVLEKQKLGLWLNGTLLSMRVLALGIGVFFFNSADIAVKLFAISGALYWFLLSYYILHIVKIKVLRVFISTFSVWLLVLLFLFSLRILIF